MTLDRWDRALLLVGFLAYFAPVMVGLFYHLPSDLFVVTGTVILIVAAVFVARSSVRKVRADARAHNRRLERAMKIFEALKAGNVRDATGWTYMYFHRFEGAKFADEAAGVPLEDDVAAWMEIERRLDLPAS